MNNIFRLILVSLLTILTTCSLSTRTPDPSDPSEPSSPPGSPDLPNSPTLPVPTETSGLPTLTAPSVTVTLPLTPTGATEPPTTTPERLSAQHAPPVTETSVSTLPAPLLFLTTDGQVARLEMGGTGRTDRTDGTGGMAKTAVVTVTNEPGRVVEFAVSPTTGALACLVEMALTGEPATPGENGTERLLVYLAADGQQRREVFHGPLSSPLFLADDESIRELDPNSTGQRIAYRVGSPLPDVPPERAGRASSNPTTSGCAPSASNPTQALPRTEPGIGQKRFPRMEPASCCMPREHRREVPSLSISRTGR
ncbi:MAG: hypothetical protein HC884_04420 [Chloroflexaceae bacterium]|nr:hypothetical protein [Chloroflexaceae bacterium]